MAKRRIRCSEPCDARQNAVHEAQAATFMATSTKRKMRAAGALKRERLELRLAPAAKKLIQRAMSVSGLAAGDLAYEGARRVLDEHERMVLT
ncbi:MAG: DUF1778 domain-containing protein, partial [Candidatus Binatia bacterium]